jgi:hypothetical protein
MSAAADRDHGTTMDRIGLGLAALIYVAGLVVVGMTIGRGPAVSPTATAPATVTAPAPDTPQPPPLARHEISFPLKPAEGFEFKYRLDKGGSMVYTWSASGPVKFEFHGEPDGARAGYADTYREGESQSGSGLFVAPTRGIHGWYWENTGQAPVTVTLKSSGFYTAALELRPTGPVEHRLER